MNKLSVIIPVYNDRENLSRCLDALERSTLAGYQLIVVSDGCTDGVEEVAEHRCDRFVKLPHNSGQSKARNTGANHATAGLLFFLDADITVGSDTLERIVQEFEAHPDISALFCSYGQDTPARNFVSQFKNLQHHYTHKIARREAVTFCGGFGAIRSEVFRDIGGFEEKLRSMEDVQMGYRLSQGGHRILLCPSIQLTHNKTYSLRSLFMSDVFHRAVPWTRLMLERKVFNNDLNTSSNNVASVIVVFLMLLSLVFHPAGLLSTQLVLSLLLIMLNAGFLAFLYRARGPLFATWSIPMLWLQYAYSGLGLGLGILAHLWDRFRGLFR